MRRGESVFRAPGLGQCCLYRIQLFTARLQLDPKQRCICAIARFLRQRGRDEPAVRRLPSPPPSGAGRERQRRLGDATFLPTSEAPKAPKD